MPSGTLVGMPHDTPYRAVVVPLDGSELAERALTPGAWLAERFGAELHLLSADVSSAERLWFEDYLESVAQKVRATATHSLRTPDLAAAARTVTGDARSGLLCMATHGRSRSAAILGSTFLSVAVASSEPLVAVGPSAAVPADDPRRIVACLDGSFLAELILPTAAAWARALGARLSLITVTDDEDPHHDEYLQRSARREDLGGLTDVDTLTLRTSARPHDAIVDHLGEQPATLVAATTHARTGFDRARLGSVVARIIHDSPVPVLVQPAR